MTEKPIPEGDHTAAPSADRRGRLLALGSLLTYSLAVALPALEFQPSRRDDAAYVLGGLQAALGGWQAVFVLNFAWFANPLYLISLRLALARHWRSAAALASMALLLALHTVSLRGRPMPGDGAVLIRLHAGFYVWLASMLVVIVGSLACRRGSTTN